MLAARDISDFSIPATFESMTSRDSSSARARASSAVRTLPSTKPPLITSAGSFRAASTRRLAVATTSPCTNATAVGPERRSSSPCRPASVAARRSRVFFATANRA